VGQRPKFATALGRSPPFLPDVDSKSQCLAKLDGARVSKGAVRGLREVVEKTLQDPVFNNDFMGFPQKQNSVQQTLDSAGLPDLYSGH
jgi:hypothetical protein